MIAECGRTLVQLLSNEMVPEEVQSQELIALRVPQLKDQDYIIGIFLYHLDEDKHAPHQDFIELSTSCHQYPSKAMSLFYVIFVNEDATFGGFQKEQEDRLLERMIQIVHDTHELQINEQICTLEFEHVDLESRIRLWQSFSKSLQPALYVQIHPVMIASRKTKEVHRVKERILRSERREE